MIAATRLVQKNVAPELADQKATGCRPAFTDTIYEERRARREELSPGKRAALEANFVEAQWAGTSRHPLTGRPVLLLAAPSGTIRYHLGWRDAFHIISAGIELWLYLPLTNDHSFNSSGSPHSDGLPKDGQAPVPETKDSNACSGLEYASNASSSKNVTQRPFLGRIANIPCRLSNIQYPFIRFSIGWFAVTMVNAAGLARKARPAAMIFARGFLHFPRAGAALLGRFLPNCRGFLPRLFWEL